MNLNEIKDLSDGLVNGLQQISYKIDFDFMKREDLASDPNFIEAKEKFKVQLKNLEKIIKQKNDTDS